MTPPFREDQSAQEQAQRRKAGLDCHYCGYPVRKGVKIDGRTWHRKCAAL